MDFFLIKILVIIGLIGTPAIFLLEKKWLKALSLAELKIRLKLNKKILIFMLIAFTVILFFELQNYIQNDHIFFNGLLVIPLAVYFHLLNIILHKRIIKKKEQEEIKES